MRYTGSTKKKDLCFIVVILHRNRAPKQNLSNTLSLGDTLFCDFYFPPTELGLLDVLDAEVAAAVSVDLGLVPRGGLIIGAVGVGCSCETESTRADCCGKKNTTHTEEPIMKRALQSHSVWSAAFLCVYVPQVFIANGSVAGCKWFS